MLVTGETEENRPDVWFFRLVTRCASLVDEAIAGVGSVAIRVILVTFVRPLLTRLRQRSLKGRGATASP